MLDSENKAPLVTVIGTWNGAITSCQEDGDRSLNRELVDLKTAFGKHRSTSRQRSLKIIELHREMQLGRD